MADTNRFDAGDYHGWNLLLKRQTPLALMNKDDKIRILIAEDEESFLRVLTTVLEGTRQFSVYPCEDGDEAVEALKRTHFDVAILDFKMPGKTGLNVLQWLHEQKSDIPVIMLTGAGTENIAVEAMKLGAYDYIRKDQFDKSHFPIIVSGVYERYLFKKERERIQISSKERDRNLASLEVLVNSVSAFSQLVTTTLTTINLLTDENERLIQPHVLQSGKDHVRSYFLKIREQYKMLAAVTTSIASLSKATYDDQLRLKSVDQPAAEPVTNEGEPQRKSAQDR